MSIARIPKLPFELNNNSPELFQSYKRLRNESIISISSASSCHSDSSEDVEGLQELTTNAQNNVIENPDFKRLRSMSDGATQIPDQEPFEVFPSLPDSVLEKMGLLGNGSRERISEDDLEQKFVSLSLAFTIDAATITDRCERQRRYRDQTETNLNNEIERLVEKANRMQSLCVDAETTELLSTLLCQIDIVMKASIHANICSERYGAVQHEQRLQEAVSVMIGHVNVLKQQRDSARRQLQYTKKVLQNPTTPDSAARKLSPTSPNSLTKRRASIATITRPNDTIKSSDARKVIRRTSDLALRQSALGRISRPSRLELGVDLVKIKEGLSETAESEPLETNDDEANENDDEHSSPDDSFNSSDFELEALTLRKRLEKRYRRIRDDCEKRYEKWSGDGTIHEVCSFCALICFSFSVILLANILIEVEFTRRGLAPSNFFWFWSGNVGKRGIYTGT